MLVLRVWSDSFSERKDHSVHCAVRLALKSFSNTPHIVTHPLGKLNGCRQVSAVHVPSPLHCKRDSMASELLPPAALLCHLHCTAEPLPSARLMSRLCHELCRSPQRVGRRSVLARRYCAPRVVGAAAPTDAPPPPHTARARCCHAQAAARVGFLRNQLLRALSVNASIGLMRVIQVQKWPY